MLTTIFRQELSEVGNITSLTNKGSCDKIDIVFDSKVDDIVDILFGKGGQVDHHSREVHVLSFANGSVVFDAAGNFSSRFVRGKHRQDQTSISDQDFLSWLDGCRQSGVRAGQFGVISLEVIITGENDGFSLDEVNFLGIVGKESTADLGSLGVEKNGCCVDWLGVWVCVSVLQFLDLYH